IDAPRYLHFLEDLFMIEYKLFIDNEWRESQSGKTISVEDPATREDFASVQRGNEDDVSAAVAAAKEAAEAWGALSPHDRAGYLRSLADVLEAHSDELCDIISSEIGMPRAHVFDWHVAAAISGARMYADIAEAYEYTAEQDNYMVIKEPFGVVAGITPWNYPLTQATTKLFAAMAAGNTVVLKPSRQAPVSCLKLAECVLEAGFPKGVFNVVTGVGGEVGNALAAHPDVDALSFTGSTDAGIKVGQLALTTVKKITLELGGKSPLILLPGGDAASAVVAICSDVFMNTGQTCCSFTRFLVPRERCDEVEKLITEEAAKYITGDPTDEKTVVGPLVSEAAYRKVKGYIEAGLQEGARLVYGKVPEELTDETKGYFVEPAVFMDVTNDMTIARDEIFGPVISVIAYDTVDEAVRIANDTKYGLAGCVFGNDRKQAMDVLRRIKAGYLLLNGEIPDDSAPFGGYKMSGIGREGGIHGFEEFLQIKSISLDRP
ncbi:MAG: aldehyde dehydrogenase family protein, partial [Mogibacterium sp.]|nr:aldehyde dehydrogenase family protein [Mogibacterium sp.]